MLKQIILGFDCRSAVCFFHTSFGSRPVFMSHYNCNFSFRVWSLRTSSELKLIGTITMAISCPTALVVTSLDAATVTPGGALTANATTNSSFACVSTASVVMATKTAALSGRTGPERSGTTVSLLGRPILAAGCPIR